MPRRKEVRKMNVKNKGMIQSNKDAHAGPTGTGKVFQKRQTLAESPRRFEIEVKLRRSAPQSEEEVADAVLLSRFRQLKTSGGDEGKEQSDAMNGLEDLVFALFQGALEAIEPICVLHDKLLETISRTCSIQRDPSAGTFSSLFTEMAWSKKALLDPAEPQLLGFRLQLEGITGEPTEQQIASMRQETIVSRTRGVAMGTRPWLIEIPEWWPTEGRILAIERDIPKIEEEVSPIVRLAGEEMRRRRMDIELGMDIRSELAARMEAVVRLAGKEMRRMDVGSELAARIERVKRAHGGFLDTVDTLNEWEANDPVKQWERGHPELAQKLAEKISIGGFVGDLSGKNRKEIRKGRNCGLH